MFVNYIRGQLIKWYHIDFILARVIERSNPNLEIVDVHPSVRGVLGLLADSLGHPVDQLQVEGVLLGNLVLGRELQAVLVVLSKLRRETACVIFRYIKVYYAITISHCQTYLSV